MPEEIFVLALVSIISGSIVVTSIAKMIVNTIRGKRKARELPESSMTTSELQRMLTKAIAEAQAPLHAQIEELERRVDEIPVEVSRLQLEQQEKLLQAAEESTN